MHASIATIITYLDDIAFEPIAQSQKSNSCKWPGIHRNWLAVVLLVVYCVSVIWIVLLSNGRRAGLYVQILTICPSPFKRSVDCKRLNLASTECSTKYAPWQCHRKCSICANSCSIQCASGLELAQSQATTTQFRFGGILNWKHEFHKFDFVKNLNIFCQMKLI